MEKKSNKKRIITTLSAMALAGTLAVFGTLAYLNNVTETKTNVFTSGKDVNTELTETNWDENEQDLAKNYYPGQLLHKNPVMHNTSEDGSAIWTGVKLEYVVYENTPNGEVAKNVSYDEFIKKYATISYGNDEKAATQGINPKWEKIGTDVDNNDYFIYADKLEGQTVDTDPIFNFVQVLAGIEEVINTKYTEFYTAKLDEKGNIIADTVEKVTGEMNSETTYYAKDGEDNVVKADAFVLPHFEIKVTGYAVQGDGLDKNQASTEIRTLSKATFE